MLEKLEFLQRPETYGPEVRKVEARETHLSWVFLTEDRVYKLKKPVLYHSSDNRTVADRRHTCEEELRLNRRLAPDVYLGTVPLTMDMDGHMQLEAGHRAVDWLVKMRRLPQQRMLDAAIRTQTATAGDAQRLGRFLGRFYASAPIVPMVAQEYRLLLETEIRFDREELASAGLPRDTLQRVTDAQLRLLAQVPSLFDDRATRIVEAHGDLRPEHICLEATPAIIDCLEFDRRLRILDMASELAFLRLECDRLGAPDFGRILFDTCCDATLDHPSPQLIAFYRQRHACLRARIAVWHLRDGDIAHPEKWTGRAAHYLRLAERAAASCAWPSARATSDSPA